MKLYYSQGSCSLASHIILEEAGAKFETQRLNLREGEQRKPEYLKINPKGKVPTLVLDGGEVLTENPAIMSYVADLHPQANLLAKPGELARARAQEWLAWSASTLHPGFGPFFAARRTGGTVADTDRANLQGHLDRFDGGLAKGSFVLGEQFSVADAYTLVFFLWAKNSGLTVGENHLRSAKVLAERAGVKRALATQELTVPV